MDQEKKIDFDDLEDSPDFPEIIEKMFQEAVKQAISETKRKGIDITYLKGNDIITESPSGKITVIGRISDKPRRKVKKGTKQKLF